MRVVFGFMLLLSVALVTASCGRVESAAQGVSNDVKLPGHWKQNNNNLILTFKGGKVAYTPVKGWAGKIADLVKNTCESNTRSYKVDANQVVYAAEGACPEVRVTIGKLTDKELEIPSLSAPGTTLIFAKMNDADFEAQTDPGARLP